MDSISTNQELRNGDSLLSKNGNFKAIFQDDGNFVIYKWAPCWNSNMANEGGFRILLQEDCHLVMYTKDREPVWRTDTWESTDSHRMRLTLTNAGHLVLDNSAKTVWSSETSTGTKV